MLPSASVLHRREGGDVGRCRLCRHSRGGRCRPDRLRGIATQLDTVGYRCDRRRRQRRQADIHRRPKHATGVLRPTVGGRRRQRHVTSWRRHRPGCAGRSFGRSGLVGQGPLGEEQRPRRRGPCPTGDGAARAQPADQVHHAGFDGTGLDPRHHRCRHHEPQFAPHHADDQDGRRTTVGHDGRLVEPEALQRLPRHQAKGAGLGSPDGDAIDVEDQAQPVDTSRPDVGLTLETDVAELGTPQGVESTHFPRYRRTSPDS